MFFFSFLEDLANLANQVSSSAYVFRLLVIVFSWKPIHTVDPFAAMTGATC